MAVSVKVLGFSNNSHFEFSLYFVSVICFDVSEERTVNILQPSEKKIFYPPKLMENPNVNHGVQPENRPLFEQQSQHNPEHFVSDKSISFVRTTELFLLNPKDRPSRTAN